MARWEIMRCMNGNVAGGYGSANGQRPTLAEDIPKV